MKMAMKMMKRAAKRVSRKMLMKEMMIGECQKMILRRKMALMRKRRRKTKKKRRKSQEDLEVGVRQRRREEVALGQSADRGVGLVTEDEEVGVIQEEGPDLQGERDLEAETVKEEEAHLAVAHRSAIVQTIETQLDLRDSVVAKVQLLSHDSMWTTVDLVTQCNPKYHPKLVQTNNCLVQRLLIESIKQALLQPLRKWRKRRS
jgi:hypothetical protein